MGDIKGVSDAMKDTSISHNYLPVANPTPTFWQSEPSTLHDHRTTEEIPEHSDVVIVGAGYSGISTAYHLINEPSFAGKTITILEARGACSGATGRNGGHLRPDLYGHIPTFVERAGEDAGAEVAKFEIEHCFEIKKVIEKENIDCDFTLTRTVDVWCNEGAAKAAKVVFDDMASKFEYMKDAVFYTGKNVEGICGVKGAVACASYTAGTMWPYKFILHLIRDLIATGRVNLQTNTPAISMTCYPGAGVFINTPRGKIHASQVVHANNAYVGGLLPEYKQNIIPCKGICCRITVPEGTIAPLLNDSYINREADKTLHYLIPRPDGSIIVGGAQATFKWNHKEQWYNSIDDSALIDTAKDYYEGYMQRTFRGWENSGAKVDNIWTGVMGYSYDSNPHVGVVPDREGQFIVAAWNGHGMPCIWLSGREIAKMVARGIPFEETCLPRLYKTTPERISKAQKGSEGEGDILTTTAFSATKQ